MSFDDMAKAAKTPENRTVEFTFDTSLMRTVIKDGEPWFVAKDVCDILGLDNPSMAASRLDDDEKGVSNVDTLGGPQELLTVNESGLYSLAFTSRKPEAKRFRKWVTSEVLPSIRKTGGYHGPKTGYLGLQGGEVEYERWLLERALLDAQVIAIETQRIGVHFLQQITDDPEQGAARSHERFHELHTAVRENVHRATNFLDRARPGTRWRKTTA